MPPPTPTGPTITVSSAAALQAALDGATGACEIRITPGTYMGNFTLRNIAVPTGEWIIIRADAADANFVPVGVPWVTPSQSTNMAKLKALDTFSPTFIAANTAHNYWFYGIEFLPNTDHPDRDLVSMGDSCTTLAQSPHHITFESCYLHGDPNTGGHRGIRFDVANGVITSCYFEKFIEVGRDSQALAVFNGPGPFDIENSYFEATGENVLFGGADPSIPNLVPSDITFKGNYCYKPISWKTTFPGSVKNLFELKNAQRVTVENNVFENNWIDAQSGHAIVLTIRNQDGNAPWSVVRDVTWRYNIVKNTEGAAFNMLGKDDIHTSPQGTNMSISNTLVLQAGMGFFVNNGYQPTTLSHCTIPTLDSKFLQFLATPVPPGEFTFQNNVVGGSTYGIAGEGTGLGTPTLDVYAPSAVFNHNVIEAGPDFVPYPSGNAVLTNGTLAALFDTNYRYLGVQPTTDGQPMGADIDAIIARIPWYYTDRVLTGVVGTSAQGTVSRLFSVALSGSAATGAVGTVSAGAVAGTTLTGIDLLLVEGFLSGVTTVGVTGVSAAAALGSIAVGGNVLVSLAGIGATSALGSIGAPGLPLTISGLSNIAVAVPSAPTTVEFGDPTITGGSAPYVASFSPLSGTQFNLGTTQVVCTVLDALGQTTSSAFNVSVAIGPSTLAVACPTNISVAFPNSGLKRISWTVPVVTGGVGPYTITSSPSSGSYFDFGSYVVTCTVQDAVGAIATCQFTVIVATTVGAMGKVVNISTGFTL